MTALFVKRYRGGNDNIPKILMVGNSILVGSVSWENPSRHSSLSDLPYNLTLLAPIGIDFSQPAFSRCGMRGTWVTSLQSCTCQITIRAPICSFELSPLPVPTEDAIRWDLRSATLFVMKSHDMGEGDRR